MTVLDVLTRGWMYAEPAHVEQPTKQRPVTKIGTDGWLGITLLGLSAIQFILLVIH